MEWNLWHRRPKLRVISRHKLISPLILIAFVILIVYSQRPWIQKGVSIGSQASPVCRWSKLSSTQEEQRNIASAMSILYSTFTLNVWEKTELMLDSLLDLNLTFTLLVVDDFSTDGTFETLTQCKIWVERPEREQLGVTHLWNLAFSIFYRTNFQIMFMANNDVLVPTNALEQLVKTMDDRNCYIAVPTSTIVGKGYWPSESVEHIYSNYNISHSFVNHAKNYNCVQAYLESIEHHKYGTGDIDVRVLENHYNPGFLGFFFGMTRTSFMKIFDGNSSFLSVVGEKKNIHQEIQIASQVYAKNGRVYTHILIYV